MSIMEDKHNLGATSAQAQGVVGSNTLIDRFSALPNEVVLHIMSSTEVKDLIRLRCVSKKCKKLSLSVPSLNIDGSSSIYKKSKSKRLNLLNHLDRFLMQRKDCKIGRLRIAWSFNGANTSEEQFRIATWIITAVSCNIEYLELVFSIDNGSTFELPYDLLDCSTLKTLKVDLSSKTLRLPALAVPSNLQRLHLKEVIISEEVWKWISSLHLTELRLEHVNGIGSVTVEIPSLIKFHLEFVYYQNRISKLLISGAKLEDIDVRGPFNERGLDSLKIVASNLRRLKLLGYLMNQLSLGRFTFLEKAELFLSPTADDNGKLFEVFSSVSRTKVLHLDEKTIEVLRDGPVQLPLHDISCFRAYLVRLTDDIVPNIAHLLRGMPNLNTLFIATSPSLLYELFPYYNWFYRGRLVPYDEVKENAPGSGCNKSYWSSQNLACIDQLKEVRLELSNGTNELDLACYILENAKNLKKMVIIHTYHQSPAVRMINACNLSSCDARVLFYRRKKPTLMDLVGYQHGHNIGPRVLAQ
uniref:F-box/LRR-repeat protein At5g02910-like n=1 Tax=Fragaria vesca subsp. vesca TaxID=101020 RepID=UPI0005CAE28E|nr:PREDICTED: F-box/LRR-repeat protein At5g02910-like [Fragaria vesca subsp. vesca]